MSTYWKRKTVEASMHIDVLLRCAYKQITPGDMIIREAEEFLRHLPKPR